MNGMTVKEAADYLGVGERQVLYDINAGRLAAKRFGQRVWVLDEASVKNFVRRPVGRPRKSR